MKDRKFGKTDKSVKEIGLGTWQLGTVWGDPFNWEEAEKILETAYNSQINLVDTADVYNNGDSERAIGMFLKKHPEAFYTVTKVGRKSNPHVAEAYTPEAIEKYIDEGLKRMEIETHDMVLLHCPPSSVYQNDEVFHALDRIKEKGKIKDYGVSIEKVSEGLDAMQYNISAIEVIFNMFRMKPLEELFPAAREKEIGIIARVPLASGLLTGKMNKQTSFGPGDHRHFNRDGQAFDKGETFSGVDFNKGLEAVEALKELFGQEDISAFALKWILMHEDVSVVIPGSSKAYQLEANLNAADMPDLTQEQMAGVRKIYDEYIKEDVEKLW